MDLTLNAGVAGAGDSLPGAPPAGTHYSFYAVQYDGVTECVNHCDIDAECPASSTCDQVAHRCKDTNSDTVRCPMGSSCDNASNICMDDTTHAALVKDSYSFKINDFQIQPLINTSSPCFIEHEERPYPGLHVTQELARLEQDTGISDPLNPPADANPGDITDVLVARKRNLSLLALQNGVRAVTSFSNALPPGVDPDFPMEDADANNDGMPDCVADNPNTDPGKIPPPYCIDDESNARRLTLCKAYWKAHPDYYEGSDLIFTLPLNGHWYGAVSGMNPKNGGPIQGVSFFLGAALTDFDALVMSWQYNDTNGDGEPDYPNGTIDQDKSQVGYFYMGGSPVKRTRDVINVPLSNRSYSFTGEAAIFPGLGEDHVHF